MGATGSLMCAPCESRNELNQQAKRAVQSAALKLNSSFIAFACLSTPQLPSPISSIALYPFTIRTRSVSIPIRVPAMKTPSLLLFSLLLLLASLAAFAARDFQAELTKSKNKGGGGGGGGGFAGGIPGFGFGPGNGGGFNIPGIGGGWGAGYGGPAGGYSRGGVVQPSVVCSDRGPCYKKRLTCPAKCFSSYSHSGKGYGGGGGGGGCTIDCKKRCVAYC